MVETQGSKSHKRLWETPQLTVIVRGMPEEAVLLGCKASMNPAGAIQGGQNASCRMKVGCGDCSSVGGS